MAMDLPGERLAPDVLEATWATFRANHEDIVARNLLMVHYASLVRYVAYKTIVDLPSSVDRDDLVSYGQFGLLKVLKSYEPDRGVKFESYAAGRIRGSILDELRYVDFIPRSVRSKTREYEKVAEQLREALGRTPDSSELAEQLGISMADLWKLETEVNSSRVQQTLEANDSEHEHATVLDAAMVRAGGMSETASPGDHYDVQELGVMLAEVIHSLPERDKVILALCYLEEMTLAEVGDILGVTESRVSQLQGRVLQEIRARLSRQVYHAA